MKIQLTNEEKEQVFYNALCNVYGSDWFSGYGISWEWNKQEYAQARAKLKNEGISVCIEDILMEILRSGGTLTLEDFENDGDCTKTITLQDIYDRIENTPTKRLLNSINGEDDIEDADVILQTIIWGEVMFG